MRATFSPRPPPPYAALMAIGRPCSSTNRHHLVGIRDGAGGAGRQRRPDLLGDVARRDLVAERLDGLRARADPDQAGADHRPRELGVLGEEPVAGVDGIGARAAGDRKDLLDRQVRVGAGGAVERVRLVGKPRVQCVPILLGVHRDRQLAGIPRGTDHTDGDLAAVRDEHLGDVRHACQPTEGPRTPFGWIAQEAPENVGFLLQRRILIEPGSSVPEPVSEASVVFHSAVHSTPTSRTRRRSVDTDIPTTVDGSPSTR